MVLFEYFKLFEYYQKLLRFDPSHCLIQFSIKTKLCPMHASRTCVRFVIHSEFDVTGLNK